MSVKRIVEDYEARLSSLQGRKARGKAEWERYGNGETKFDLAVKGLEVPEGISVEVLSDGVDVGTFQIKRGRGQLVIDNPPFRPEPGTTITIVSGAILMSGDWEVD